MHFLFAGDSRAKESVDMLHDAAFHILYQKPYASIIESTMYRVCQVYAEQTNRVQPLPVPKLIEDIFYRLTDGHFTINKIESKPSTEYEVIVNTEAAVNLFIQKVSQGTFSIISNVLTIYNYLMARYSKEEVSDEDVRLKSAIVFIDEIDVHLHLS